MGAGEWPLTRVVWGMLWGLSVGVHVSWSAEFGPAPCPVVREAGGSSQSRVVRVVAKVQACVPGGDDAPLADLQIGIDDANHYVVLIQQIVQCARIVGERSAQRACHDRGSDLARHLSHGDALGMAMWGKHNRCPARCSGVGVGSGQLQWYKCDGARAESRAGGGRAKDCVRTCRARRHGRKTP